MPTLTAFASLTPRARHALLRAGLGLLLALVFWGHALHLWHLPLLDELLGHLTRIKVVRLAARLASELELPWAELAQRHSRRLGGGRRWVAMGRTGERLDLAATP